MSQSRWMKQKAQKTSVEDLSREAGLESRVGSHGNEKWAQ